MIMKYYSVVVKMGHLGTGNFIPVKLYIKASNIMSATKKAQKFPGVKHGRLPLTAKEIGQEEYELGLQNSEYTAFMQARFGTTNLEL